MILIKKYFTISISKKLSFISKSICFCWTPLDHYFVKQSQECQKHLILIIYIIQTADSCRNNQFHIIYLILLIYMKPLVPSHRHQSADLQRKSTDWFRYKENMLPNYLSTNHLTIIKWFLFLVTNSKRVLTWDFILGETKYFHFGVWSISYNCLHDAARTETRCGSYFIAFILTETKFHFGWWNIM